MKHKPMTALEKLLLTVGIAGAIYITLAWPVFQFRNPKCNEMGFYRHFIQVVTYQKIEKYQ